MALSQQAHACLEWRPKEKLITFNMTCLWTFHTNSLLHRYLFLMHVHEITMNTCLSDKKLVLFYMNSVLYDVCPAHSIIISHDHFNNSHELHP